jgi:O-antigen ligase
MTASGPAAWLDKGGRAAAIAIGFSIPLSTAADNTLLAIVLACFLAGGAYRERLSFIAARPPLTMGPALFVLLAAGALLNPTRLTEAFAFLGKYADLALIPVIAVFLRDPAARRLALYAFSAALVVSMLASYALFAGLPRYPVFVPNLLLAVSFKQSVTHSLLLGFATFLFVELAGNSASRAARVVWSFLAALALTNIVFIVPGRTTLLVVAALAAYWAFTTWGWRGLSKAAIAGLVIVAIGYAASGLFWERVTSVIREYSLADSGTPAPVTSSVGLRLEFYRNSLQIIRDHPLVGVGTGGFQRAYAEHVDGTAMLKTANPHSEYLLIAVQVGIAGVLLMLSMFWLQWRGAPQLASPLETHLARALVITFGVGCLFNSLLLDHTEGLFFAWLTGLLYAGLKSKRDG